MKNNKISCPVSIMRLKYCTLPVREKEGQSKYTSHCYPMTPPTMLLCPIELLQNSIPYPKPKSYA